MEETLDWLKWLEPRSIARLFGCGRQASDGRLCAERSGCNAPRRTSTALARAECGSKACNANCGWGCSREGDALVSHADALAMQVRNKEMSDGEAHRRFAEYKTQFIHELRRANSTTVCIPSNNMVTCY